MTNIYDEPYELHGKKVARIWWDEDESLTAKDGRVLIFTINYCGDRDECWVVQHEDGAEVARHNCRFIATIEWAL